MENNKIFAKGPKLVRDKLHGKMFLVPSFITVLGVFCGFFAIVNTMRGSFVEASIAIGIAIILDGLDGRVARRLNATSEFGKEFDSLSDLIAFGVAPALLIYQWAFTSLADQFGLLISFIFVVCAATRLARFNIQNESEPANHFTGLPTPGAAFGILSLVFIFPEFTINLFTVSAVVIYAVTLSFLMVSNLKFFSVKKLKLSKTNPRITLVLIAVAIAFAYYYLQLALFISSLFYVFSGPVMYLLSLRKIKEKNVDSHRQVG